MTINKKLLAGSILFPLSMVLAAPVYAEVPGGAGYQGEVLGPDGKQTDISIDLQPGKALKLAAGDTDEQVGNDGDEEKVENGGDDEKAENGGDEEKGENDEKGEKGGNDHENEGEEQGNN